MAIIDLAPNDGSSSLEVSVVRNFYGLQSVRDSRIILANHLLVTHPSKGLGSVEGYIDGEFYGPFVRTFVEHLTDKGDFEFIGQPTGRQYQLQEYCPGAKVRFNGKEYLLIADLDCGPMYMRTTFGSNTHLWRFMEGHKRGTAQWRYSPDFSNIRTLGPEISISKSLNIEARSLQP